MGSINPTIIQNDDPAYTTPPNYSIIKHYNISEIQRIIEASIISSIIIATTLSSGQNNYYVKDLNGVSEYVSNVETLPGLNEQNKIDKKSLLLYNNTEKNDFIIGQFSYKNHQVTPIKSKSYIINKDSASTFMEGDDTMNNKIERQFHIFENVTLYICSLLSASTLIFVPFIVKGLNISALIPGALMFLCLPSYILFNRLRKKSD